MRLDRLVKEKRGEILRIAAEHGARDAGLRVRRTRGGRWGKRYRFPRRTRDWKVTDGPRRAADGPRIPSRTPGGRRDCARTQCAYSRARAPGGGACVRPM